MQIPLNVLTQSTPGTRLAVNAVQRVKPLYGSGDSSGMFAQMIEKTANKQSPAGQSGVRQESPGSASARTGSKSEDRQAAAASEGNQTAANSQTVKKSREPRASRESRELREPNEPQEIQKPDDDGIYIASFAGMLGTLNDVTFILEGDKELITDTLMPIQASGQIAGEDILSTGIAQSAEAEQTADFAAAQIDAIDAEIASYAKDGESLIHAAADDLPATGQTKISELLGDGSEAAQTGGIEARTPETIISEQSDMGRGSGDRNPESSENGGLSPLENENDNDKALAGDGTGKARRTKEFADTVEMIKKANGEQTQGSQADIVPAPLSAGIKPEQFRAAEQMTQAALNAPVEAGNLFDEMVSRIDMMRTEDMQKMTIELKPEFLGKVDLEIALNASGLHIKINAEDHGVRSMVNSQINSLIESLTSKGIEVAEVEVSYTGFNSGEMPQSRGEQTQPDRTERQHGRTGGHKIEEITIDAALRPDAIDYYIDTGVSSVEYRA